MIVPMVASLMQPVAFSLINVITGKEVMRAGKKTRRCIFSIISIVFNDKSGWKKSLKSRRRIQ